MTSPTRVTFTRPEGSPYHQLLDPGDYISFHQLLYRWNGEAPIAWSSKDGTLTVNGAVVGLELDDLAPAKLAAAITRHRGKLRAVRLTRSQALTDPIVAALGELAADPLWLDARLVGQSDLTPLLALGDKLRGLALGKLSVAQLKQVRQMTSLEQLTVRATTDSQLGALCASLPSLRSLTLEDSAVTGAGLAKLAQRPELRDLAILPPYKRNRPSGGSFEHLVPLTQLTHLRFWNTLATDDDLGHLTGLRALRYLHLYNSAITDAGLAHLTKLPALDDLFLAGNKGLTEDSVQVLAKMPSLTKLAVPHGQLSAAGIARLEKALPQCAIVHY